MPVSATMGRLTVVGLRLDARRAHRAELDDPALIGEGKRRDVDLHIQCAVGADAYLLDHGKPDPSLISMAKWYGGETGVYVTNEALQLHGGYGYISDYDIQRFYRDAKIVEIYEGSKEVEKLIIGSELRKKIF